jgi:hypothetical protein
MRQYIDGVEMTCLVKKEVETVVHGAKRGQFCSLMYHRRCSTNCT